MSATIQCTGDACAAIRIPLAVMVAALLLGPAAGVRAQTAENAAFIVRLGTDTTAVERYVRSGDRVEAVGLSRSPRTTVRRYTVWLTPDGGVARYSVARDGETATEATPAVAGAIPLNGQFFFTWELALMRAHRSRADSTVVTMMNGSNPRPTTIRRAGRTEYTLLNQFDVLMRARLDDRGRLMSVAVDGGTSVERVAALDFDALARDFAARDAAGRGMGTLSPLENLRATVAGASIAVEYSRPSLRGRDLRSLVPLDRVWRTGANNATRFTTDRPLRFGSLNVPAGEYSLFTIPHADSWTLVLNRQTGQSGLDYDATQDLGRAEMRVRNLDAPVEQFTIVVESEGQGGVLRMRWGRTEASVPFRTGG
jgi:hypothetical protein